MSLSSAILLAVLASSQPAPDDGSDVDRTPIRCRPAPYYVADRGERAKPERLILTGSRVPILPERRARPCLLMQAPAPVVSPTSMRVAD